MELPGIDAAKTEAIRTARDLIAESKKFGVLGLDRTIEVKDSSGATVHTLRFEEAVARPVDPQAE